MTPQLAIMACALPASSDFKLTSYFKWRIALGSHMFVLFVVLPLPMYTSPLTPNDALLWKKKVQCELWVRVVLIPYYHEIWLISEQVNNSSECEFPHCTIQPVPVSHRMFRRTKWRELYKALAWSWHVARTQQAFKVFRTWPCICRIIWTALLPGWLLASIEILMQQ
jgi:hypothetical protein